MWTSILPWLYFLQFLPLVQNAAPVPAKPVAKPDCKFKNAADALAHLDSLEGSKGIEDDQVVHVLLGCQKLFDFNLGQITRFVEHRRNTLHRILARKIPLCVLAADNHPKLARFKDTIQKFEDEDKRIRQNDAEANFYPLLKVWKGKDPEGLDSIEFRKIETLDETFGTKVLQQWFSVKLHFAKPIHGIIVQSIEGFLGIPFGEFRADFSCAKDPPALKLTSDDFAIIPCKYRPRTSFVHPQIFVVGGDTTKPAKTYQDIVFHFNFINAPCHDVAAFQFLIITIKNDKEDAFLTPVYELKIPSSYDGVPSYYYPDHRVEWKTKVECTVVDLNPNCLEGLDKKKDCSSSFKNDKNEIKAHCDLGLLAPCTNSIIPFSRTYDNCITGRSGQEHPTGDETCPPGPFFCTKFSAKPENWLKKRVDNLELLHHCGAHIPRHLKGAKDKDKPDQRCKDNLLDKSVWEIKAPTGTLPTITTPIQLGRRRRDLDLTELDSDDLAKLDSEDYDDKSTTESYTVAPISDENEVEEMYELLEYDVQNVAESPATKSSVRVFTAPPDEELLNRFYFFTEFQRIGIQHYKFNKRLHGLLMILAFLVINPISIYLARYFKETPAISYWGIPRWMMAHIILSMISITIIWVGMVACLGNAGKGVVDCDGLLKDGKLNTLCTDHQNSIVHMFLGTLTVAAFHMSAASAWSRPRDSRGMYMTTHSFSGYFTFIGATVSSIFVNSGVCFEITAEALLLFMVNLVLWGLECGFQCIQDKRLEIQGRHYFPMLEGLRVQEPCPPCHCFKIFVFIIAILANLTGGFLVVSSYIVMNNEDLYSNQTSTDPEYYLPGLFFENCKILNYVMVINKIVTRDDSNNL